MRSFSVRMMCRLLTVSSSGFYAWLTRKPSKRALQNKDLTYKIKTIFEEEKCRSGSPRITKRLYNEGIIVGKYRVARIMQINGWRAKATKKFKATTNSKPSIHCQSLIIY